MKKLLIGAVALMVIAGGAVGGYMRSARTAEPEISTAVVDRGDVLQVVGATGTLEAVKTVDVGTQVNGVILEMFADFNAIVRKGQKLAKIDPKTIEAAIQSDTANLESARANLDRQNVALEDSLNKLRRAEDLALRNLITRQDLETAQVTVKTNRALIKAQEASIRQVQAKLDQDLVNLGYTDIYAPVDGIVVNRKVDVGQTVVSNNQATSMFQVAEDLTKMQLKVSVDESDVGLLRPGQAATFSVDAYVGRDFTGTVSQVRLQPVITQNVVTYVTIINVPNPTLELKPGMTANVRIEIARRENVMRVPVSALRFRATAEMFDWLKLPVPADLRPGRTGADGVPGGQRAASETKTANARDAARAADATTIDALFGELVFEPTAGRVWTYAVDAGTGAKSVVPVAVRTGISDGTYAELLGAALDEGRTLLTSIALPRPQTGPAGRNPLMPGQRPGGDHGGGGHGPGGWGPH